LIARLDVEDRQLVVERLLRVEGIEQIDVLNVVARRRIQHLLGEVDEQRAGGLAPEEVLDA